MSSRKQGLLHSQKFHRNLALRIFFVVVCFFHSVLGNVWFMPIISEAGVEKSTEVFKEVNGGGVIQGNNRDKETAYSCCGLQMGSGEYTGSKSKSAFS